MSQTPESDKKANNQLKSNELPSPKRGAFPTPGAKIEKAKKYIPKNDGATGPAATGPVSPEDIKP
jgi:hypothetical protein